MNLHGVPRFYQTRSIFRIQGPLLCLIGGICLVFLLQMVLGYTAFDRFMVVPAEIISQWEMLRAGKISEADPWVFSTLLSYAFLHGNLSHLLGNMFYLWVFGALAAELLGAKWLFIIFIFTAISGGICHVALDPTSPITMLGASGAITGLQGLYLAMAVRWQLPDPHVWPIARPIPPSRLALLAVIGFAADFMGVIGSGGENIAYGAHLGGFIGGMLLGGAVVPMPRVAFPRI